MTKAKNDVITLGGYPDRSIVSIAAVEQTEPQRCSSSNGSSRKETVKVTKTMFVCLNHAYASDTDLYKHEGVTSDEAEPFYYEGETPVKLWRVEDGPQEILITADANEALAKLEAGADSIFPVKAMGQHDEKEPG